MPAGEYVRVERPWDATFDARAEQPAAFFASVMRDALRYGMPSRRRFGIALAAVARHELFPAGAAARALRVLPKTTRQDLDDQLDEIESKWDSLQERARRLPSTPGPLSMLELRRSAGVTRFVFGASKTPLLVLKIPADGDERVDVEVRALEEAAGTSVAPLPLGRIGAARLQEGIEGTPLRVEPVVPENAANLSWKREHAALANALTTLASRTCKNETPHEVNLAPFAPVADDLRLPSPVRNLVAAAVRDLTRLRTAVLRHVDTSPQNCLIRRDGSFSGLVDWEVARSSGVPGWDMLNAAIAYMEQGVGLTRWSTERALETFRIGWSHSPFWAEARSATNASARAAAVSDHLFSAIEVAFHARRLGRLLIDPKSFATGPDTARRMLEIVCAR